MYGAERILAERHRQIEVEGFTPQHDLRHDDEMALANAAGCYVQAAIMTEYGELGQNLINHLSTGGLLPRWPWSPEDWKPTGDAIRDLEKAGALIAAEIDHLLIRRAMAQEEVS